MSHVLAGANHDLKDTQGYAAIHHCVLAVASKNTNPGKASTCIRALHKCGAEMNRKTGDGRTALHLAVEMGIGDLCLTLRDVGADINIFSTDGYNAVYYGCE
jgi:hypothetical protein